MNEHWVWALGMIAIGTLAARMLPLWWTRRQLQRSSQLQLPLWLTISGPMMIAAMLGVSLVPAPLTTGTVVATLLAGLVTVLSWRRSRSLGLPVVAGVLCYGLVIIVAGVIG
jgi:branched-subunit amino acid transport protein